MRARDVIAFYAWVWRGAVRAVLFIASSLNHAIRRG